MGDPRVKSNKDGILVKDNVMCVSEVKARPDLFTTYLNMSKPIINLTKKPGEYMGVTEGMGSDDLTAMSIENGVLEFKFNITNPTDPTPYTTKYEANIYIDQNADGRFNADEIVEGIEVKDSSGNVIANRLGIDEVYSVIRRLPDSYVGSIAWKLEVQKLGNGNEHIHNSVTGITYNKSMKEGTGDKVGLVPNPIEINVIQICPDGGFNITTDSEFNRIFDKLEALGMYDINVTYVPHKALKYDMRKIMPDKPNYYDLIGVELDENSITIGEDYKEFIKLYEYKKNNFGKNNKYAYDNLNTQEDIKKIMDHYDMICLGFDDSQGVDEGHGFSEQFSLALVDMIEEGKSILFSHDTTSYYNYSENIHDYYGGDQNGVHAYYMNHVARNALGLDRYGVTNNDLAMYNIDSGNSGNAISKANTEKLEEMGYSYAYKPKSGRREKVAETHGYLNYALHWKNSGYNRYRMSSLRYVDWGGNHSDAASFYPSTNISQVNKGRITSFPYDVNMKDFGGKNDMISIAKSHVQYYQLNMNEDDVTVWYTLADSRSYDVINKNDAINAYYIYNKGNVTYTGAGHRDKGNNKSAAFTEVEKQLFTNTMIAAYRPQSEPPILQIREEGSEIDITSIVVPFRLDEGSEDVENDNSFDMIGGASGYGIPFMIHDRNLVVEGKSVTLTYSVGDGKEITFKDPNNTVDNTLKTDKQYVIDIPQSVITSLESNGSVEVTLTAKTSIEGVDSDDLIDEKVVVIVRTGFLPLN